MTDSPRPSKPKRQRRPKPPAERLRKPAETVDTRQRLFLAAPLPPDVVTLVDRTIASMQREDWPVRWTAPGNAHITLHFLGEIEPERAQLLRLGLPPVVAEHDAFSLRTADLGVFPKMKRPKVIWLGLYGPAHRLHTLRDAIGEHLKTLEFEVEDREFHPHITLGRIRDARGTRIRDLPGAIRARIERAAESGEVSHRNPTPVPITEIHLVQSHLTSAGPVYEVLERYPLRTAPVGSN